MLPEADLLLRTFAAVGIGLACGSAFVLVLALRNAVGTGIPRLTSGRNRLLIAAKWIVAFPIWYFVVVALTGLSRANGGSHFEALVAAGVTAISAYSLRRVSLPISKRLRSLLEHHLEPNA
jgi:hypothetical protein